MATQKGHVKIVHPQHQIIIYLSARIRYVNTAPFALIYLISLFPVVHVNLDKKETRDRIGSIFLFE